MESGPGRPPCLPGPGRVLFDPTHASAGKKAACESHILLLLLINLGLLMIGLDAEYNQAVLVSGQEAESLTLNETWEVVKGEAW